MPTKTYRHARTDYEPGIVAIYDNGARFGVRYTVVYEPFGGVAFPGTVMDATPHLPNGVCLREYTNLNERPTAVTRGRVIRFEDLPEDCQRVVRDDLAEFAKQESAAGV